MKLYGELDIQKALLTFHTSFEYMTMFKRIDTGGKGYLIQEDFDMFFNDIEDNQVDFSKIINYLNDELMEESDNRLTYINFANGLKPIL